jgi:peptide methionine sulfoxide reductase MsrA
MQETTLLQAQLIKEEHQEYLLKNPKGYCNHRVRFKAWPDRKVENK